MNTGVNISHEDAICVAGHRGMVGSAIVRRLQPLGYWNIVTASHAELDLSTTSKHHSQIARVYL